MNYLFSIDPASMYAPSFEFRIASSSLDELRRIGPRAVSTVTIADGTQLTTIDPVSIALLDDLLSMGDAAFPGGGVTIAIGTGAPVVGWDANTAEAKITEDPSLAPLRAGLPLVIAGGKIVFAGG